MRILTAKTYWLIGASEGLGRALAHRLSAHGAHLVLSARSADRLTALAQELPGPARVLPLDVQDSAAVTAAAAQIGPLDGMVYLAGLWWPQSAQDWTPPQVEATLDVNLMGAARAVGAVLPGMLARGAGHLVLTGSLSAYRGLPGAVGYSASKAGLTSLAESLDLDLRGTGVDVQLVQPGFIRTQLTDKNDFPMPQLMSPERAAQHMLDHMMTGRFKRDFPAPFAWLLRSTQFWPHWLYRAVLGHRS